MSSTRSGNLKYLIFADIISELLLLHLLIQKHIYEDTMADTYFLYAGDKL